MSVPTGSFILIEPVDDDPPEAFYPLHTDIDYTPSEIGTSHASQRLNIFYPDASKWPAPAVHVMRD